MLGGDTPEAACGRTLRRLVEVYPPAREHQLALAALRTDGAAGGASLKSGFAYARFDGRQNHTVPVEPLFG